MPKVHAEIIRAPRAVDQPPHPGRTAAGAPVLAYARARTGEGAAVRLVRADADILPFGPGSFDYVLCCLTLHHLAPAEAVAALAGWARVARRAVVVVDLERSWLGYVGTWL